MVANSQPCWSANAWSCSSSSLATSSLQAAAMARNSHNLQPPRLSVKGFGRPSSSKSSSSRRYLAMMASCTSLICCFSRSVVGFTPASATAFLSPSLLRCPGVRSECLKKRFMYASCRPGVMPSIFTAWSTMSSIWRLSCLLSFLDFFLDICFPCDLEMEEISLPMLVVLACGVSGSPQLALNLLVSRFPKPVIVSRFPTSSSGSSAMTSGGFALNLWEFQDTLPAGCAFTAGGGHGLFKDQAGTATSLNFRAARNGSLPTILPSVVFEGTSRYRCN
mmetsp:Transcript_2610/g.6303  ORF Transcript_2610/g.6303 Transcript_2610/m.6303 type:complete len:277 (-) Transcript_2610:389-1219(-)